VVSLGTESCLIAADEGAVLRGFADILDGEHDQAGGDQPLAAPEGDCLRCTFKRRTIPRSVPAADYFAG